MNEGEIAVFPTQEVDELLFACYIAPHNES